MSKDDGIEMEGRIIEVLAGSNFRVQIINEDGTDGPSILCYLGGKIRQNSIKIMLNDLVKVSVSPYDFSRGRIIYRSK